MLPFVAVFADVRSPLCVRLPLSAFSPFFADQTQISDAGASALAAALQGSQLEKLWLSEYLNESLDGLNSVMMRAE